MLTAGLVCLNVHESLTFDGTEICLHPDIFSQGISSSSVASTAAENNNSNNNNNNNNSSISGGGNNNSSSSSNNVATTTASNSSSRATATEDNPNDLQQQQHHQRTSSSPGGGGGSSTVVSTSSSQQKQLLHPGDMIEIRVWDPLPRVSPAAAAAFAATAGSNININNNNNNTGGGSSSNSITGNSIAPATPPLLRRRMSPIYSSSSSPSKTGQPPSQPQPQPQISPIKQLPRRTASAQGSGLFFSEAASAEASASGRPGPLRGRTQSASAPHIASLLPPHSPDNSSSNNNNNSGGDGGDGAPQAKEAAAASSASASSSTSALAEDCSDSISEPSADATVATSNIEAAAAATGGTAAPAATTTSTTSSTTASSNPPPPSSSSLLATSPPTSGDAAAPATTAIVKAAAAATTTTAAGAGGGSSGELPPVFPRIRTPSSHQSKPPPATKFHRRNSTAPNVDYFSSTTTTTAGGAGKVFRHVRDLSDMTADTMLYAGGSGGGIGGGGDNNNANNTHGKTGTSTSTNYQQLVELQGLALASDPDLSGLGGGGSGAVADDDLSNQLAQSHSIRLSFIMLIKEESLSSLKGSGRVMVSLLRQVADLYRLSSYDMVTVHKIDRHDQAEALRTVSADHVLMTIKDQFLSRGDMQAFQETLIGSWIYQGQRLVGDIEQIRGFQAHAREIRHGDQHARSGIITKDTKIAFRSHSARIFWLIQISAEMWDYDSPYDKKKAAGSASASEEGGGGEEGLGNDNGNSVCETYFDKWITFVRKLFGLWTELKATHSLTVVFFSRTFLSSGPFPNGNHTGSDLPGPRHSPQVLKDVYGRRYEDHYRTVIDNEITSNWESLVVRLKEAFLQYPCDVGWNLDTGENSRRPSTANQGNVLEAINVTLSLLQYHYLDRDLNRTGNSILVVSAGNGVFEVDKGLASITYQRMMDNGIGSDMLSLGLPPLHIAPFFLYINDYQSVEKSGGVDTGETYYEVPHWMHLSFVSYESDRTILLDPTSSGAENEVFSLHSSLDDGIEVAANGFLLPRVFGRQRQRVVGVSNSGLGPLQGNAAATPRPKAKQVSQERQLIKDRDFQDILEACRPRNSGDIPSALKSLLRVYQQESDDQEKRKLTSESEQQLSKPTLKESSCSEPILKEWGSLDFDDTNDKPLLVGGRKAMTLGRELKECSPRRASPLPVSPPRVDELDNSNSFHERISPTTSYASQVSGSLLGVSYERSLLGVSYDRPFLSGQTPSTLTGIQLQRSPSLEFCAVDDDDSGTVTSEGSGSASSAGVSIIDVSDFFSQESGPSSRRHKRESIKYIENMSKFMKAHDRKAFCASLSPKITAKSEGTPSRHNESSKARHANSAVMNQSSGFAPLSHQLLPPVGQVMTAGGIGPAIAQSRTSPESERDFLPITRVPSIGRLHGIIQIPEMGSRGLSPLLLPPVASISTTDFSSVRRNTGSRRSIENQPFQPHENVLTPEREPLQSARSPGTLSGTSLITGFQNLQRSHRNEGSLSISPPTIRESLGAVKGVDKSPKYRQGGHNERSLSVSPPTTKDSWGKVKLVDKSLMHRKGGRDHPNRNNRNGIGSRRKKVFNPFRQQDEDEVLAKKSHNRRRWSHVFPLGEVEFKRHAGPNWRSLCSPAIVPLSIDYFPTQQEIDHNFTFSIYNVTCREFEHTNYSSNKELLSEMVRQRLTQDYQLVPPSHVNASNYRRESLRDGLANRGRSNSVTEDNPETIRKFLSMGHRLQVLTYDPKGDAVEVIRYNATSSQVYSAANTFQYFYFAYNEETNQFRKVVQTFSKYSEQYNWNKVDRIICGDEDREMREGMRFRRIMFALLPDSFHNADAEKEYIAKFRNLLEYLNKLRGKDDESRQPLDIKVVSSDNRAAETSGRTNSTPGINSNATRRFYVPLCKNKRDNSEWMEVALDATFDTSWSYRIMLNWLVGSSVKVEAQVNLLQRRCTQYGLNLVPLPDSSVSRSVYSLTFRAPVILEIREEGIGSHLDSALASINFLHDGVFYTDVKAILGCIERGEDFDFGRRWGMPKGRQFVHRSGTLFARILEDKKGWIILVVFTNRRYVARDAALSVKNRDAFQKLVDCVELLKSGVKPAELICPPLT